MDSNKRIFISHSHKDAFYASKVIDILEKIGVGSDRIFCSSVAGYGVPLGEDFLNEIKKWLNEDVVVIFLLSQAYYGSPVSLCEMGACWITGRKVFPILIPPMTFEEVGGVFNRHMGFYIDDGIRWSQLKEQIEEVFDVRERVTGARWEQFKTRTLQDLKELLPDDDRMEEVIKIAEADNRRVSKLKKDAFNIGYACLMILDGRLQWQSAYQEFCKNFDINIPMTSTHPSKVMDTTIEVSGRILARYGRNILIYLKLSQNTIILMGKLLQGCEADISDYLDTLESIPELEDKREAFEKLWNAIPSGFEGAKKLSCWLNEIKEIIDNA